MVHDHLKGLRLDRRTLRRRDWVSKADLEREMAALPDVSDKIDVAPDAPAPAEGGKAEG